MSLIKSFQSVLSKPDKASYPFIFIGFLIFIVSHFIPSHIIKIIGKLGLAFCGFCFYFFRDPERIPPKGNKILSAADGRVTSIRKISPPAGLDMDDEPVWCVSTFLSVLNVHINRSPVAGELTAKVYHHGTFINASLDKASENNERNALCITTKTNKKVAVVQIAGLIARRIICRKKIHDHLKAGERFGLIRFGSRTDVYLPKGVKPIVSIDQIMVGGETVLAYL